MSAYVSRAGPKLAFALSTFGVDPAGLVCADLGCSTGGFTDCLLQHCADRVYAVDTGYGVLAWKLRQDQRVVVLERTNALHLTLPEPVDLVTVDVSWTPQHLILPQAVNLLKSGGKLISLVKPHYEARKAHLSPDQADRVFTEVLARLQTLGLVPSQTALSPVLGEKAGNREFLLLLTQV